MGTYTIVARAVGTRELVDEARVGLYGGLETAGARDPKDWVDAERVWIRFAVEAESEAEAAMAAETVLAQEMVKALGGGEWVTVSVSGSQP